MQCYADEMEVKLKEKGWCILTLPLPCILNTEELNIPSCSILSVNEPEGFH